MVYNYPSPPPPTPSTPHQGTPGRLTNVNKRKAIPSRKCSAFALSWWIYSLACNSAETVFIWDYWGCLQKVQRLHISWQKVNLRTNAGRWQYQGDLTALYSRYKHVQWGWRIISLPDLLLTAHFTYTVFVASAFTNFHLHESGTDESKVPHPELQLCHKTNWQPGIIFLFKQLRHKDVGR